MGSPTSSRLALILLFIFIILFILSGIKPYNRFTWFLEVVPALLGIFLLIVVSPNFRFTNLVIVLVFIHSVILLIGGYYSYARVPLFSKIRDIFHLQRNNYDKVGHLAQGFVPVLIVREMIIRFRIISTNINELWMPYICVFITLGYSAMYELIEWFLAEISGRAADDFLALQGDIWDTQSDMLCCFIGSIISLALLTGLHDQYLARVEQMAKAEDKINILEP